MTEVYNEEYLLIDYRALLDIAVLAAFGKSSGLDQLPLHLAEAIMPFQPKKFLVKTDGDRRIEARGTEARGTEAMGD